jgi:ABC-type glycerol-3-phosphate transport system substrate-binding protein
MHKKMITLAMVMMLLLVIGVAYAQDDVTTIVYWHEWDGEQQVGIDAVIALFEEANPDVKIENMPLGRSRDVREQMSTGIVSGELPNLVGATFSNNAQGYWLDGVLLSLDDFYNDPEFGLTEEELATLDQSILNEFRPAFAPFNGQLLGWPVGVSTVVMSVNLDMLAQLNADGAISFEGAPTTLDQFREAACAANELTSADGGDVQGFPIRISAGDMTSFIVSNGGRTFDSENNRYDFTNDGALETLQFFQDLLNDGCGYIPDGSFVNTADFAFGLNPFAVGSSVGVPFIAGDIESSGSGIENWINTTTPWSEGNRSMQVGSRGVGLIQGTPEQDLATWRFIKFWATNPEAQIAWTEAAQYQPYNTVTRSALSDDFLGANPQFSSVNSIMGEDDINLFSLPSHPAFFAVNDVMETMIVNITTGDMDVMEAAQAAEDEANEIFEEMLADLADM